MSNPVSRVSLRVEHLENRLTPSQFVGYVQPALVANDPAGSEQWAVSQIGLPNAWNVSTGTGQTIVAVIDSGIDASHPDLAANLWRNPGEIAGNGIDDDRNGFVDDIHGADFANNDGDPFDDTGHGTNVAGVLGAVGNNGVGITGVAWTTRIMALKFLRPGTGGLTSDAARAIDYAIVNGAKVINLSWGGPDNDPTLAAAIGRARSAGAIVVAAAGNQAADIDTRTFYPASNAPSFDNVVSVTATDRNGNLAYFSSVGDSTVTLAAPGVNLRTTQRGGGYQTLSGTSLATPIVAGAVALTWDTHPNWSYQQVIAKLKSSVEPLPSLTGKTITGGRINVAKLLDATTVPPAVPPPPPPAPPTVSLGTGPRIVASVFRGPSAERFDRVWVKFDGPIDPATLTRSKVQISGPDGGIRISALLPVSGKNNTEFYLMLSQQQTRIGDYRVRFLPSITDSHGRGLSLNASDGYMASSSLGGAAPRPMTGIQQYEIAGPRTLNERRTNRFDFNIDETFTIKDVSVNLDITHGRTSDLSIRLVAPDGTTVNLFNRRDGVNLTQERFNPVAELSRFDGKVAKGTWSLQIFDLIAGTRGTLNSVSLNFTPS